MAEVFLSYKAEDRSRVSPLVEALEADGLTVWWDAHIGGGEEWRETILSHLEAARCVIVVWSKRSIGPQGQFVRDEATRALRLGTYLPVRIDKIDPPLGFGEAQAVDLRGWKGDRSDQRYWSLLSTLQKRLGLPGTRDGKPVKPRGIGRRTLIAGGAIATAGAVGLGGWIFGRPSGASRSSIAVLPFANLSGDPAQAYFSDGIAEELRSALSRIAGLKVVARTSCEAMRDADAKSAADKLDVATILTGSVRRSPTMIRISAQLVDGRSGLERWSQVYDRPVGDSLKIQSDIAGHVARALAIQLGVGDRRRLSDGGTANAEALDLLLRARAEFAQADSEAAVVQAISTIDSALALDPNYAEAAAAKANLISILAGTYARTAAESQATYARAAAEARRAIKMAPNARAGYGVLANVLHQQLFLRAALVQFEKMRSLPGSDGLSLPTYAIFLSEIGQQAKALEIADEAVAIDPLNPRTYLTRGMVQSQARRHEDAVASAQQAINIAPDQRRPRAFHAYFLMMAGRNAEADRQFASLKDKTSTGLAWRAVWAGRRGDLTESNRILSSIGGDAAYYQHAQILTQQGRKEEAIVALDKAWNARDPGLTLMLVDPLLDPLRPDPRFNAMLQRLDIP